MQRDFIDSFDTEIYTEKFRKHPVISDHHKKYPEDMYAPAWKTVEHMTFGAVFQLFLSISDQEVKSAISKHYNIDKLSNNGLKTQKVGYFLLSLQLVQNRSIAK